MTTSSPETRTLATEVVVAITETLRWQPALLARAIDQLTDVQGFMDHFNPDHILGAFVGCACENPNSTELPILQDQFQKLFRMYLEHDPEGTMAIVAGLNNYDMYADVIEIEVHNLGKVGEHVRPNARTTAVIKTKSEPS